MPNTTSLEKSQGRRRNTRRLRTIVSSLAFVAVALTSNSSFAAASAGCDGGGFALLGLTGDQNALAPARNVPATFLVKGKYVEFTVDAASFGLYNWTLTGAPNPL